MISWIKTLLLLPIRFHLWGSLAIVLGVAVIISAQIADRSTFADSELKEDVMERWGAPIRQPAPSVRYVESGAVFNTLTPMALSKQHVSVDASMNYRKRGLIYFSGFDFAFRGEYEVENDQAHDVDLVFVFPLEGDRNRVLLSDLSFSVNGEPASIDLNDENALVWTGRARPGEKLKTVISFRGRGLDAFTYLLDPDLRVHDFRLDFTVSGGRNYDYQPGVVPAAGVSEEGDAVNLNWRYSSLESGVPVGLILPSTQSFDDLIAIMVGRAPVPFLLFFAGLIALCLARGRSLRFFEAYLVAAGYGLFFVLLAYLAAFLNFYLAGLLAMAAVCILLTLYMRWLLAGAGLLAFGLCASFLFVPALAVVLQGYTGLIYTIEVAGTLIGLMILTTRPAFNRVIDGLNPTSASEGEAHAI